MLSNECIVPNKWKSLFNLKNFQTTNSKHRFHPKNYFSTNYNFFLLFYSLHMRKKHILIKTKSFLYLNSFNDFWKTLPYFKIHIVFILWHFLLVMITRPASVTFSFCKLISNIYLCLLCLRLNLALLKVMIYQNCCCVHIRYLNEYILFSGEITYWSF